MEVCAVVRFCYKQILLYYTQNCLLGVLLDYCTRSHCFVVLYAVLCSSVCCVLLYYHCHRVKTHLQSNNNNKNP
jgi:hypothetical protein